MTRLLALMSCTLALILFASMAFDAGAEAKSGKDNVQSDGYGR
jgi:hypothetical protein